MTKFSVVIPLYNKANFIGDCLESVLKQTHQDFEVIIVNDGSTDGSKKVVETFKDPRIQVLHQNNKGASAARNSGIEKAKNKWIALIDADDYWYPNHLEELNKMISKYPKADLVCNNYEILLNKKLIKYPFISLDNVSKSQYIENYFLASKVDSLTLTCSFGFTKKIFEKVGGFDEDIRSGQDTDLMIRLGLNSIIAYNPIITSRYNSLSENNLSKSEFISDRIKIFNKYTSKEKKKPYLKTYLDLNRFALAISFKMNKISEWKSLRKNIDSKNLNQKQNLLLKLPGSVLQFLKNIQTWLIKKNIYKSAHH